MQPGLTEKHLIKQIKDLASKSNAAVSNCETATNDDEDDPREIENEEEDDVDVEEDDVDQDDNVDPGEVEEQAVFIMIQDISSWQRLSPPEF